MEREFAKHGKKLNHIIGPGMGHDYDKESLAKIAAFLKEAHEKVQPIVNKSDTRELHALKIREVSSYVFEENKFRQLGVYQIASNPIYSGKQVVFDTFSYGSFRLGPQIRIHSINDPFKPVVIDYHFNNSTKTLVINKIENIQCFRPSGLPLFSDNFAKIKIDANEYEFNISEFPTPPGTDPERMIHRGIADTDVILIKRQGKWIAIKELPLDLKMVGYSGPIDQAFLNKFVFVKPTGKALNPQLQIWYEQEMQYQLDRWRRCFRGEITVIDDTQWDKYKYYGSALVLWGDENCNSVIRQLKKSIPALSFTKQIHGYDSLKHVVSAVIGTYHSIEYPPITAYVLDYSVNINHGKSITTDAIEHAKKLSAFEPKTIQVPSDKPPYRIHPYHIVLNSGPTFRDEHDRNNANQTPKLPDWAIIDVTTPPDGKAPGKVVTAGFFDNEWKFVDPAKQEAEWRAKRRDGR